MSTSHCQYEEAEGQTFHPAYAGKYGYKAVTICSDDTNISVMSLMFQYKMSVPLIKQFGTKTMVRLIDLAKFVTTTGIYVSISFTVHIVTGCDTQHSHGPQKDKHFHLLDQQYRDNGRFSWLRPELEPLPVTGEVYQSPWSHIRPIVLSGKVALICQQLPPHMNCLVNTYKEQIVSTPYGCNVLNRFQKHQVFLLRMKIEKAH